MKFLESIQENKSRNQIIMALLSGIMVGISYTPFPPITLFFCFVPLWIVAYKESSVKRLIYLGIFTAFIFTLIGFNWIYYCAKEFGYLSSGASLGVLLLFCLCANLHVTIALIVTKVLHKRISFSPLQYFIVIALLTYVSEYLFPMVFPWNMGYSWLYASLPGYHWADTIGFTGLSSVSFLLNGVIAYGVIIRENRTVLKKVSAIVVVFFLVFNVSGFVKGKMWSLDESTPQLQALVIQANIGNTDKHKAEYSNKFRDKIIEEYITLTEEALKKHPNIDMLFWPETAFPYLLDKSIRRHRYSQRLLTFLKKHNKPIITGGYSYDRKQRRSYNGLFLIDENGEHQASYRKSILLAFGEYFPGTETFPFLKPLVKKYIPAISDFKRGLGPTVFTYGETKFGIQICYEGLFPWFSKGLSDQDAMIFFNATNDSWFGDYFEPYQHLYMTLARAIEFRRPLIRSTNTGISTVVLADGTILDKTPIREKCFHAYNVPYTKEKITTIYQIIEPFYIYIICILTLLVMFWQRIKTFNQK